MDLIVKGASHAPIKHIKYPHNVVLSDAPEFNEHVLQELQPVDAAVAVNVHIAYHLPRHPGLAYAIDLLVDSYFVDGCN